jgi:hypothetical protein
MLGTAADIALVNRTDLVKCDLRKNVLLGTDDTLDHTFACSARLQSLLLLSSVL